jgi:mRNA interferase RelE/StbE
LNVSEVPPAAKYDVQITKQAEKTLLKLSDHDEAAIRKKIDALANDPRPHGVKKLKGQDDLHRIRVGNFRVIYAIRDAELVVLVVRVADRKDAYWDT